MILINIDFLGGALEVGGSSVLMKISDKNILFDAGIRQSASKDSVPNFRAVQTYGGLDAIIISHAHLDHIGCLPIISKEYPNAKIYMNNMTRDLVKVLLYDSLKIMNNRDAEIPLYAEVDVENTLNRIFTINYEVKFPIFENMDVTFYNAGHIAGASCVYLQSLEGAVFYSGDFSVFAQRTVEGAKLPRLRPDVAIVESTYGDRLHSNREIEERNLIEAVNECVENNGKMIIPAFALGRAQEVILILKGAMNKGSIKTVKVYVDGMVRDINRVYKNNPLYLKNSLGKKILRGISPFYDDNIIEIKATDNREEILAQKEPVVIISSSGMITGGPSAFYAEKLATMENGYIVITGYQDEESPGRKILDLIEADEDSERYLSINGLNIPVKCKIKRVGLSAHADKNEIKGVLERISARNIILVHGNEEVIRSLGKEISAEFIGRTFTPACGEEIVINIRNPRKQLNKSFPYSLNIKYELCEDNINELWQFVYEKYNNKFLTIEELAYVWTGEKNFEISNNHEIENKEQNNSEAGNFSDILNSNSESMQNFKKVIINSVYFENDLKRLFLFRARIEDDIKEDLKPKELTQQELMSLIEEKFKAFEYKKISVMLDRKEVILNFDFPHGIESSINNIMDEFYKETEWKISVNEKINNSSAELIIKKLIDPRTIKKISFYPEKLSVRVFLNGKNIGDGSESKVFEEKTGWKLYIVGEGSLEVNNDLESNKLYFEVANVKAVEQNVALNLIDKAFEGEKHKPYKKSIKTNQKGKYIELVFIYPKIGQKFEEKLGHLSRETGWSIAISDKVNQNELFNIAKLLCDKNNVLLKKNPSYNPSDMTISLNIIDGEENFINIKDEFERTTGCSLILS
ncbi:MBL fold metallo-hydrolase RNA specificity domain-containing protein [Clostridium sp.]|uniref:MBL fold metallo-hydrolase n=1 Tax=Clostridium sp. TaxID=1506 RepID=UPI0028448BD3|nr:MBL fold metallo-hydrolase RNA specificity domain-containing protein [Clostridium sp.]MDR3596418.1 MBL fold metallo-hydrolase RNA specificity domain-containing protein [Clostridium sp.]